MKTPLSELPLVEPEDRATWRTWLAENHDTSSGVWLAVGKKGGTRTTLSYDDAVEEALCFGWIDSTVHAMDQDRFRQLFTPRKRGSNWSRSNKERVERLISEGLMTPAGLATIEAAKADGSWTLLDEVESLLVPVDLCEALEADPVASGGYAELSASNRKMILYWIASAKRPETRARRIAASVEALRQGRMPVG